MSLADQLAGPQGDLLGVARLLNGASGGRSTCESVRRAMASLRDPAVLNEKLRALRKRGYRGVVVMGESCLFEALSRKGELPQILPIIPNLAGFMREAVEHGMLGAGLKRAWRVGPVALTGLGLRGLTRLPSLARRDFPSMLQSFVELELADFTKYHPPVVFLQAQVTDLALAMHNPRILTCFAQAVRNRCGAQPAFCTQNFGALCGALKSWGVEAAAVVAPWCASGARMHPDAAACEHAAKALDIVVWGEMVNRLEPPSVADRHAVTKAGLTGYVREDLSVWSE